MRKVFIVFGAGLALALAASSSAMAASTTCNTTLNGQTISGNLVVPDNETCTIVNTSVSGDVRVGENAYFQATGSQIGDDVEANRSQTLFIDTGTTVGDDVEANRTAQVFVYNATIDGGIGVWRSTDAVQICGNTVDGNVHVHRSGTDILIGDPLAVGCGANTVTGNHSVSVHDNFTDVEFVVRGNTIQGSGDLRVFDNSGPVEKFVQDNQGGDNLDCFGNEQPFTASGNTGWDDTRNQCAIPPTECNATLTGQNIPGDLVVPDGASCTIQTSTVGGDVKVGRDAFFQSTGSKIGGDVVAYKALTVFIDTGSQVGGDVKASKTTQAFVFNSAIGDDIEIRGATDTVNVCGNTVEGDVAVKDSGTDILVGDPLALGCNGNTVGDDVEMVRNFTDVEFVVRGNTVFDDMRVLSNKGPAEKFVQDNQGGDELSCYGNEQPFTASGNAGWNEQKGQCAVPDTVCTSALSGQTVPGDLVVPENESCTITGTSVGDDVKVGKNAYFQAIGSTIGDDVRADKAQTLFIDTGTTVGGEVKARSTHEVFVYGGTLNGDVDVSGSDQRVQLCGNSIDGDVEVEHSGRQILFGDPGAGGCAANTVRNGHSATLEDNFTDDYFVVRGNTFEGGDLRVSDNEGTSDKFVQDNAGGDELECSGNDDPFTGTPNSFASEQGQCAEI